MANTNSIAKYIIVSSLKYLPTRARTDFNDIVNDDVTILEKALAPDINMQSVLNARRFLLSALIVPVRGLNKIYDEL